MFLKTLIVSVILVAFVMLALGVKMLFNKGASFTGHFCSLEEGKLNEANGCADCGIQDITNCPEKEN
jgi:hypothetical protein